MESEFNSMKSEKKPIDIDELKVHLNELMSPYKK